MDAAKTKEYGSDIGKPRIEHCGNHWNVEMFVGVRFISLCYMTWEECRIRAVKFSDVYLREKVNG